MTVGDVIQFTEDHKWVGCFGYIVKDIGVDHPRRYMIGVPVPQQGTAYIFDSGENVEYIGRAVLMEVEHED